MSKSESATSPSWFKLANYSRQHSLDLPGWLLQFGVRRDLMGFILEDADGSPLSATKLFCPALLQMIHSDPILRYDNLLDMFGPEVIQMVLPSLAPLHSAQPRNAMGVHPTTVEELYRTEISLNPQLRTHVATFFRQMQEGIDGGSTSVEDMQKLENRIKLRKCAPIFEKSLPDTKPGTRYVPAMDQPTYCSFEGCMPGNVQLTVNPHLPDKLLLAQFRDAVSRARTYLSRVVDSYTRLAANPTETWIDEQLLAYLDLSLEKYIPDGAVLSHSEIATLIWPCDQPGKGADKCWDECHLANTTTSLATEMMAYYSDSFWTLQASVAALLAKPSKDWQAPASLTSLLQRPKTRSNRGRKSY